MTAMAGWEERKKRQTAQNHRIGFNPLRRQGLKRGKIVTGMGTFYV